MTQQEVTLLVQRYLRDQFGRLLQSRGLSTLRRASGTIWRAEVICPSSDGEIPVGRVVVNEEGHFVEKIAADDVIRALRAFVPVSLDEAQGALPEEEVNPVVAEFADFSLGDDGFGDGDDDEFGFLLADTYDEVRSRVDGLLAQGTPASKREGLQLLPRLLAYPETRGEVLAEMAGLEYELGDRDVALGYLDAASREMADRSNLEGLERVAALALEILGEEAYQESMMRRLLQESRERLAPMTDLFEQRVFSHLDETGRAALQEGVEHLTLPPGNDLVGEGDPADHLYVIESGQFSVVLEAPDGSARTIRCIFPGELIGEAAVLTDGPRHRSATIRADRVSTVWRVDGNHLLKLFETYPQLLAKIQEARDLKRVHSFFSMHETMGQLDVRVRDQLMGCIMRIARHPAGAVLVPPQALPPVAVLIAEGGVEYRLDNAVARRYGPDTFAALRDTIHRLPCEGSYVVSVDSTLVEFDPARLRELCDGATPAVLAVLERLE